MSRGRLNPEDLSDESVPKCLFWDRQQVADFVVGLGYEQYKDCFLTNEVNGRRLIHIHASTLPQLGISDFQHIKDISGAIRKELMIERPDWSRRIAERPRDDRGLFLELKSFSGQRGDELTYKTFLHKFDKQVFQPPLSNHCAIIPHDS